MALTLYLVYMWVPTEQNLGVSQRIFYFHVPLGWIGMVSIMVVAVASILHLATGKQKWDDLAYSTAEIGIIFASLILVTGAIWGTAGMGRLVDLGREANDNAGAVVHLRWLPDGAGVRSCWNSGQEVRVGHRSDRSYRRAHHLHGHRLVELGTPCERNVPSDLDEQMLLTLLISVLAFTVLYVYLLMERYSLRRSESDLDELSPENCIATTRPRLTITRRDSSHVAVIALSAVGDRRRRSLRGTVAASGSAGRHSTGSRRRRTRRPIYPSCSRCISLRGRRSSRTSSTCRDDSVSCRTRSGTSGARSKSATERDSEQ